MAINGIDKSRLLAMYGNRAGMSSVQGTNSNVQPASSMQVQKVDIDAINKLAQKNAIGKTTAVSEETKAGAATLGAVNATTPIQSQAVAKIDAQTANGIFGKQLTTPNAAKYNNMAAGSAYSNTASASANSGYGVYDSLKSFKSGDVAKINNNPFAGLTNSNDNNSTMGLSFSGSSNLNQDRKMFIA